MLLRIISAEWEIYNADVQKALLPTLSGMMGILPKHMNMVTPLVTWHISYVPSNVVDKSVIDSFSDHSKDIEIKWWLCVIDNDIVTVTLE
jgi:hypothetical protein